MKGTAHALFRVATRKQGHDAHNRGVELITGAWSSYQGRGAHNTGGHARSWARAFPGCSIGHLLRGGEVPGQGASRSGASST